MTELATACHADEHRRWQWFLALGAVLLVLGLGGITATTLLGLSSVLVFGPLLLASSLFQLLTGFFAGKGKERLLHYTAAIPEMLLGFLLMANPFQKFIGVIGLIAIFLAISGLVRLARSLEARSGGRGWVLMTGVVALLLALCVWVESPVDKLWFAGLCIAIDFFCHGVSWSALALAERKPLQDPAV